MTRLRYKPLLISYLRSLRSNTEQYNQPERWIHFWGCRQAALFFDWISHHQPIQKLLPWRCINLNEFYDTQT
jgi:hypothetical protein